jgi:hypothetical protein
MAIMMSPMAKVTIISTKLYPATLFGHLRRNDFMPTSNLIRPELHSDLEIRLLNVDGIILSLGHNATPLSF